MHQPPRTAGSAFAGTSSLRWALCSSVCIHGVLLGLWLHARLTPAGQASVSHQRGGLPKTLTVQLAVPATVSTVSTAPSAMLPKPHRTLLQPKPKPGPRPVLSADRQALRVKTAPVQPDPAPASATVAATAAPNMEAAAQAPHDPAPEPAPAPAAPPQPAHAEQVGARFANLFAPIVSRPLGHGRWTKSSPSMQTEAQAAMQREQAIQGLRQTVQLRTDALRAELQAQPLAGTCEVRLTLERQTAHIQCEQEQDQNRVAARLSGILNLAPDMATSPSDTCIRITLQDMNWQGCAITAQP